VDGLVEVSVEGTPQGGPLSPMRANVNLDALDRELERRGHTYCRYADDCNIYVGGQAAEREGSGVQVPRLLTGSRKADRNCAGECRTIQSESAGAAAKLPEPNQQSIAGRLTTLGPRLVGLLPGIAVL
jgi:hypothetical protein